MKRGISLVLALASAATLAQAQSISGGSVSGGGGGGITFSGSVTAGNCSQIAGSSQLSDSGAPCGAGLASIANGDVLSNITGSSSTPSGNTLTATLDAVFGSTRGAILERGALGWALVTPGTSGFVLTSNGAAADPTYQAVSGGGSCSDDINAGCSQVTATHLASALPVGQGGTGLATVTAHGVVVGEGTSAAAATAAGAANTVLVGQGGSADPSFATLSAEIDAAIGSTRGAILERGSSGWALITPGTSGNVLTSNGGGADPTYQVAGGAVASVSGTSGQVSCSPTTGAVVCGLPGTITQAEIFSGGLTSSGVTTLSGAVVLPTRRITGSGAVTASATTDFYLCIAKTSPAATAVNLPASPATGLTFRIKDCGGVAAADPITITPNSGNIDGASTFVMQTNWQSVEVTYDSTQWTVN